MPCELTREHYANAVQDLLLHHECSFESMEKKYKFRVQELGDKFGKGHTVSAKSLDEVIDAIKNKNNDYDVKVTKSENPENPNVATISFSKWGIRKNYRVKIQQF